MALIFFYKFNKVYLYFYMCIVFPSVNANFVLKLLSIKSEWGWNPPFWYAVFRGGLGRTQYAKGQYAVRNNSVKSYAALKNSLF